MLSEPKLDFQATHLAEPLLQMAPLGIIIVDRDDKVLFCNAAAAEISGWSAAEILGKFSPGLPADRRAEYEAYRRRVFAGETIRTERARRIRKDGATIYLSVSASPLFGEDGGVRASMVIIADITAIVHAEQSLRASEERFRSLFESSVALICTHTLDGRILAVNPAAASALGYSPEQAVGHNLRDFETPAAQSHFDEYLEHLRAHGQHNDETHLVARNGKEVVWAYNSVVFHPPKGDPYVIGSAVDITNLRQAEGERERLIAELQDAMSKVKVLTGLLPICASCKKVRDDHGNWNAIESYIRERSEAEFSHGICPECRKRLYPGI